MQKRITVIAIVLVVIAAVLVLAVLYLRTQNVSNTLQEGSILQIEPSASFSFYIGEFVSYETGVIRIKLNESGEIGGFLVNDETIVLRGRTQGDQYSEDIKNISDIPMNASVSIEVDDGDAEQAYVAKRIVYQD